VVRAALAIALFMLGSCAAERYCKASCEQCASVQLECNVKGNVEAVPK
jgi:hypothetical protein